MHQDWNIEHWEEEYVDAHIRVAHHRFRIPELPHCYRVEQVVFWLDVVSVIRVSADWVALVKVHSCLCISSVSGDSVLCDWATKAAVRLIFPTHSRVSCIAEFTFLSPGNSTPHFISTRTSARGSLNTNWVRSIAAWEHPPLAILAILKARCIADWFSCTRPPCLAIVAAMLKTYKKSIAVSTY